MSLLSRLLLCFLLSWTAVAGASEAEPLVRNVAIQADGGRLFLDADIALPLNEEVRQAAERGLPIYLTADVVVTHSRWWWFDRTDIETAKTWRIGFNALTRQWRIGTGTLSFSVASLDDALKAVGTIRRWDIGAQYDLAEGTYFEGQVRMRLDNSLLPRPMQVNALNSSAWSIATPWSEFGFEITDAGGLRP